MIEESKLVVTKEDNENFKNCNKCWICYYDLKINHKISVVFHNLKSMIPILFCKK